MTMGLPSFCDRAWIAWLLGALLVVAQWPAQPAGATAPDSPMQFTSQDWAIPVNATDSQWILAEGRIDAGAPDRFRAFWEAEKRGHERYVLFNSASGDIEASMRLGRLIRERRLETLVFPEPLEMVADERSSDWIVQDSECLDACIFAFLGGLERAADDGARMGVRQFQLPRSESGAGPQALSADEAIERAAMISQVMGYVREMGADPKLVELALAVPPTSPVRLLTSGEVRALKVDSWVLDLASWQIEARRGGVVAKLRQPISLTNWFEASLYCLKTDRHPILEVTTGYTHPIDKANFLGAKDLSPFAVVEGPGKPTFLHPYENRVIFTRINEDGSGTFRINPTPHELEVMSRGLEFYIQLLAPAVFTRSRVHSRSHFVAVGAMGSLEHFRRTANAALRNCMS
jgi:hypothetical protein